MVNAISDRMVDPMAVAGRPDEVAQRLAAYAGIDDRVLCYPPSFGTSDGAFGDRVDALLGVAGAAPIREGYNRSAPG